MTPSVKVQEAQGYRMLRLIHVSRVHSVVPDTEGLFQLSPLLLYLGVEVTVNSFVHPGLEVVLGSPLLLRVAHHISHGFQVPVLVMRKNN